MKTKRFIPKKRIAIDNKIWRCVWDTRNNCWSTWLCFGKYKTKKACNFEIDYILGHYKNWKNSK